MAEAKQDIRALNQLTKTLLDSAKGYEDAATHAEDAQLIEEFRSLSQERYNAAQHVGSLVTSLGGDAETSGSAAGAAHRAFTGLRAAMQSGTRAAVEEVERGEDHMRDEMRDTLAKVSPSSRAQLEPLARRIQADHDRWSALKHRLQGVGDGPGGETIA